MTRRPPYPFTPGDNTTGQCSTCGEVFYGERSFDTHIRGEYPERGCIDPATDPPRKDGRRYWLDTRQRWRFGTQIDADDYERRHQARVEQLRSARWDRATRESTPRTARPGVPGTPSTVARSQTRNPGSA